MTAVSEYFDLFRKELTDPNLLDKPGNFYNTKFIQIMSHCKAFN